MICKVFWLVKASVFLYYKTSWSFVDCYKYSNELYRQYVLCDDSGDNDPIEVVREDMTYWESH